MRESGLCCLAGGKGGKSESEWSGRESGQESEGKSGFGSVSRTRGSDQS